MSLMYVTPDRVGEISGGGLVTSQEVKALCEFSEEQTVKRRDPLISSITVFSRDNLGNALPEPWRWDDTLVSRQDFPYMRPHICHFYSGSFPKAAAMLKDRGCKLIWTVAAHDREVSRREHEKMGWPFPFTHLTDPKLWMHYIEGYRLADVIVCPSTVAERTVRAYGPAFEKKTIKVIPHGCLIPQEEKIKPLSATPFRVGYCGSFGADKGVRYLLEAWKRLDYRDGSLLVFAGRDSTDQIGKAFVEKYGGGNIQLLGWQNDLSDFYNSLSLYVQPSATEGFGIEVLEAMSYGRPVICSDGAGAADLVQGWWFASGDVDDIVKMIDGVKKDGEWAGIAGEANRKKSFDYSWDKVRKQYRDLWVEVLQ